jgi:dihydropyrimidine dehydrogenase (NAD+) subunit PreA
LEIDLPSGRPLLHGTYAGVNGPWMRPITLKWIARIAKEGIKVSATNGIWTWEDVVKVTMVGAYTVQTCNAILYGTKGYGAIKDFNDGVARFLEENGYKSLDEIRGKTLNQISRWTDAPRESNVWSVIDPEKCTGCRMCLNWCFTDALEVYELNGKTKVRINRDKCDACGLCVSLCPKNAGHMEGDEPIYQGNFR